ncbi:UPF0598 protein CG30010 [Lingula anatina]|uniref:UPF0598 protein CG30010 n=1 Tax=Lingula anatina TaxID=7574 RepID=A0A1S3HLW2_LINAN|nr:UPF0598 protein CG30010 [Lingula anatina]|eukprot:XP_013387075.1 UPF0598 protein CG30010 [Lingula anatina]
MFRKVSTLRQTVGCALRINAIRNVHYEQGQSPEPKIREYFYYIDHQGQLFLDDAKMKNFTSCFKEKDFLQFFFKRVKFNNTGRYEEDFPYVSPCGRERNYIRCDDLPIVFTQILETADGEPDLLSCNHTGDKLTLTFDPEKVCMLPETGRIYHPAGDRVGGVGLIKSALAIELSKYFEFSPDKEFEPPVYFTWKGHRYSLTNELIPSLKKMDKFKSPAYVPEI